MLWTCREREANNYTYSIYSMTFAFFFNDGERQINWRTNNGDRNICPKYCPTSFPHRTPNAAFSGKAVNINKNKSRHMLKRYCQMLPSK